MSSRLPLILDHWFREGPDPASGYWICAYRGCGRHRSDHFQAEGQWLDPVHAFRPQRIAPSRCRACGYHRRHSRHVPWRWDQYPVPVLAGRGEQPSGRPAAG
ncbi:hypothetical protein ACFC6U_11795 [Kitasatospora purpeofusca]|uniref:hypothetical protein n=1 Tax=Kitasatospora purpeofusca TaxID=67352 RepID=UPI0035DAEBA4